MPLNFKSQPSFSENAINVTKDLLKALHVRVTNTTLKETLLEHPDYPSILSINDALAKWSMQSQCLQIGPEKLDDLPAPFIAHLKNNGGYFTIVYKVSAQEIFCSSDNENDKQIIRQRDDFVKQWDGIVLVPETTEESGENNYVVNRGREMLQHSMLQLFILLCTVLIILNMTSIFKSINLLTTLLTAVVLIKSIGCIATSFLLLYDVDQSNPLLQKICSSGKKINCKAVLHSRKAKLFGLINWSEIGFFYFSGGLLAFLPATSAPMLMVGFFSWLNLLALPYTIFSFYYQWRIIKQWCPICIAVQILLLIEFVIYYFAFWDRGLILLKIDVHTLATLVAAFLLPVFFWFYFKAFLLKARNADKYKQELNHIKHNEQIFDALLHKQKKITTNPDQLGITLGNLEASDIVIKVCNPYCGPCAKAHSAIEELLKENENLKVQIIFTATSDERDRRSKPVKHLMAIYAKKDEQLTTQALDDWYLPEQKDYEAFAARYPMNGELHLQDKKLLEMDYWCKETKIDFTPTFFVNGYQLPEIYSIDDLKHFLPLKQL